MRKKFLAFSLALSMIVSSSVPAFATELETFDLNDFKAQYSDFFNSEEYEEESIDEDDLIDEEFYEEEDVDELEELIPEEETSANEGVKEEVILLEEDSLNVEDMTLNTDIYADEKEMVESFETTENGEVEITADNWLSGTLNNLKFGGFDTSLFQVQNMPDNMSQLNSSYLTLVSEFEEMGFGQKMEMMELTDLDYSLDAQSLFTSQYGDLKTDFALTDFEIPADFSVENITKNAEALRSSAYGDFQQTDAYQTTISKISIGDVFNQAQSGPGTATIDRDSITSALGSLSGSITSMISEKAQEYKELYDKSDEFSNTFDSDKIVNGNKLNAAYNNMVLVAKVSKAKNGGDEILSNTYRQLHSKVSHDEFCQILLISKGFSGENTKCTLLNARNAGEAKVDENGKPITDSYGACLNVNCGHTSSPSCYYVLTVENAVYEFHCNATVSTEVAYIYNDLKGNFNETDSSIDLDEENAIDLVEAVGAIVDHGRYDDESHINIQYLIAGYNGMLANLNMTDADLTNAKITTIFNSAYNYINKNGVWGNILINTDDKTIISNDGAMTSAQFHIIVTALRDEIKGLYGNDNEACLAALEKASKKAFGS